MGDWVGGTIFLHGPHLSDLLTGATEAHGSERLNNDSRPLSLLDSEETSLFPLSVCICLFELRGRAWAFSVHRNHCGEKATAHRRELVFLGSSHVFWGSGSARGGTSSFRAAGLLRVALGLPPAVGCPQVPPCAHMSPLRHVPPCTKGQGSPTGHVLPLSLLLGSWCAGWDLLARRR